MRTRVLILHAAGEEASRIEWLEQRLRDAGYDVAHRGTVLVGESVVGATDRELFNEGPVLLFGTIATAGSASVKRFIQAARNVAAKIRVFPLRLDADADLEHLVQSDIQVADGSKDREAGFLALLESLKTHFPPGTPPERQDLLAGWKRFASALARNSLVARLRKAFEDNPTGTEPLLVLIGSAANGSRSLDESGQTTSDPWSSARYPIAVIEQVAMLCDRLGSPDRLSPVEVMLLLAVPLLTRRKLDDAVAALSAVDPSVDTPDLATLYGRFLVAHQRVVDLARAARGGGDTSLAESIRAWLRLRFVEEQRRLWRSGDVAGLLEAAAGQGELRAIITAPEMAVLLRAGVASASEIERVSDVMRFRLLGENVEVRFRLVATLILLAERITVRAVDLSDALLHHLGVRRGVTVADVGDELKGAHFGVEDDQPRLVIRAQCRTPAVDFALDEHARRLDDFLRNEGASLLAALRDQGFRELRGCEAKLDAVAQDGRPLFTKPHVSFTMEPADIRELLMGTQLWGDPTLAFRELYQNALDACRYRRCRSHFHKLEYTPRIRFHEGVAEDGRAYVECEDNGIGMTRELVRTCFARAGRRFATTTEFQRELAEWKAHGIEMTPNSQFGIGVFSYFLVADELEVETCQLEPDAQGLGDRLLIRIPTASSLFTISVLPSELARDEQLRRQRERMDPEDGRLDAGTRVRLYLAPNVRGQDGERLASAQETLRRLVWFTEVELRATAKGESESVWKAGRLAPWIQAFAEEAEGESRHWWVIDVHEASSHIHYNEHTQTVLASQSRSRNNEHYYRMYGGCFGPVLSDGILTNHRVPCAIVNLTGAERPALSLTREEIRSPIPGSVMTRLRAALPRRLQSGPLTFEWLQSLWFGFPSDCTSLWALICRRDLPWIYKDHSVRSGARAFFPLDNAYEFMAHWNLGRVRDVVFLCWRSAYWTTSSIPEYHRDVIDSLAFDRQEWSVTWSEEERLKLIDRRIWSAWASLDAGPVEAAALLYGAKRNFSSSLILYASWMTGKRPAECIEPLEKLSDILDLAWPRWDRAFIDSLGLITDEEAALLGGNSPPWLDGIITPIQFLRIAQEANRPLADVAGDLSRLARKLAWAEPVFDCDALLAVMPFFYTRKRPFRRSGFDGEVSASLLSELIVSGNSHVVFRVAPALGYDTSGWDLRGIELLKGPHDWGLYCLESFLEAMVVGAERFSLSCVFFAARGDVGSIAVLVERWRFFADVFGVSLPVWDEQRLAAMCDLSGGDRWLLSMDFDGAPPYVRSRFARLHVLRACFASAQPVESTLSRLRALSDMMDLVLEGEWGPAAVDIIKSLDASDRLLAEKLVATWRAQGCDFSIPECLVAAVLIGEPLWRIHDRVLRMSTLLGFGPPAPEATYLGLSYGDLLEQSRKDHPPSTSG